MCCFFIQDKYTALHWAASTNSKDVISFLLNHGAKINDLTKVRQWHVKFILMCAGALSLKIPTREYLTDKTPGSLTYLCTPIIIFTGLHSCNIMPSYIHNYVITYASD